MSIEMSMKDMRSKPDANRSDVMSDADTKIIFIPSEEFFIIQ